MKHENKDILKRLEELENKLDRLTKEEYRQKKETLQKGIIALFCNTFKIDTKEIINSFGATPNTFGRYINR